MDNDIQISGRKEGQFFIFEARGQTLYYDLADKQFKRKLKSCKLKPVAQTGVQKFFRRIDKNKIVDSFAEPAYRELFKRLFQGERNHYSRDNYGRRTHRNKRTNFGSIFQSISDYMHLESYCLLGINLATQSSYSKITEPVSLYTKPVIRFMRESGFEFSQVWERAYKSDSKLITDLCTYVMEKHHDNLLVYRHLFEIVTNTDSYARLRTLVTPTTETIQANYRNEHGFGSEYKALFDYVIYCIAVEAMEPDDVINEYFDYLKMAREIKRFKHLNRLREQGDNTTTLDDIGFPEYRSIEKYPKGLSVRHRIVTRNYNTMNRKYDDEKFRAVINKDFEWKDQDYCLVVPNKSDDIKNEGTELNHCVGSYIQNVLDGRTQVCFMRYADSPDKSHVTVEIRSNTIQQARGYGNRDTGEIEKAWLEKYAKAKNLTYGKVVTDPEKPCPTPNKKKKDEIEYSNSISVFESEGGLCVV